MHSFTHSVAEYSGTAGLVLTNALGSGSHHWHFCDRLGRMSGNHRIINRLPLSGRRTYYASRHYRFADAQMFAEEVVNATHGPGGLEAGAGGVS